jgi:hypothetical protein
MSVNISPKNVSAFLKRLNGKEKEKKLRKQTLTEFTVALQKRTVALQKRRMKQLMSVLKKLFGNNTNSEKEKIRKIFGSVSAYTPTKRPHLQYAKGFASHPILYKHGSRTLSKVPLQYMKNAKLQNEYYKYIQHYDIQNYPSYYLWLKNVKDLIKNT